MRGKSGKKTPFAQIIIQNDETLGSKNSQRLRLLIAENGTFREKPIINFGG